MIKPSIQTTLVVVGCMLLLAVMGTAAAGTDLRPHTSGPSRGSLVLYGGGSKDFDKTFGKFVELAGGKDAAIVIVPTAASSLQDYDYHNHPHVTIARDRFNLTALSVLHTHRREEAQRESFVEPLRRAQGLWFTGGRQWRLVDAYRGTLTEHEFHQILARGGVIGGGSAGASIQGSFLVRGDTSGSEVLIGDHQQGFGFIKNSAIDQHLLPRARERDLVKILTDPRSEMDPSIDREALLGIGLDEGTAIIVRRNRFEVFGKRDGVVLVFDPRVWKAKSDKHQKIQKLHVGDSYDMARRRILAPDTVNCREP